ncbi:MAG: putative bifunctional diguanylate cyclase/phosphodiesterase [Rhodocyclaceae bacterium]
MSRRLRSIAISADWWPLLLVVFIAVFQWALLIQRNLDDDRAAIESSLISQHNAAAAVVIHTQELLKQLGRIGHECAQADDATAMARLLHDAASPDGAFQRLLVFKADGRPLATSGPPANEREIGFVRQFLSHPPANPRYDHYVVSPIDPSQRHDPFQPILFRSKQAPDLLILAIIDNRNFLRHFEHLSLGRSGEIILVGEDGQEVLHVHDGRLDLLESIASSERFRRAFSADSGALSERIHNAYERLYAFRRVPDSPLAVLVSRTHYDILSDNQSYQRAYLLVSLLITLLMLGFTVFWWLAVQRKRKLMAKLEQSHEENKRLISQLEQEKLAAYHLATHDKLTGLANRMLFGEIAARYQARAKRLRSRFAILFIDLDRFKPINDTYGHRAGDTLLIEVSHRLESCFRKTDLVSRFGGDEFVALVQEIHGSRDAAAIADKVIDALSRPFTGIVSEDLFITPSIGISIYPDDGESIDALLRQADSAMYQAKAQGRATYVFADPVLNRRNAIKNHIQAALPAAIKNGEIQIHYQPKVSLRDFSIVGLEALARWVHPRMGFISPAEFVPIAEESSLIHELGEFLIDMVCCQLSHWCAQGLPVVPVAVNVSPRQLRSKRVYQAIENALTRHRIEAGLLEIEITETGFIDIDTILVEQLEHLARRGINFAIDDFGTGFSGLSHLRYLPVKYVKIDRSFISNLRHELNDATIVSSTVSLCHNLRLQSIAEGVETTEQLAYLRAIGCDQAQGFLLSRALPPEDVPTLLRRGRILIATRNEKNALASGALASDATLQCLAPTH